MPAHPTHNEKSGAQVMDVKTILYQCLPSINLAIEFQEARVSFVSGQRACCWLSFRNPKSRKLSWPALFRIYTSYIASKSTFPAKIFGKVLFPGLFCYGSSLSNLHICTHPPLRSKSAAKASSKYVKVSIPFVCKASEENASNRFVAFCTTKLPLAS